MNIITSGNQYDENVFPYIFNLNKNTIFVKTTKINKVMPKAKDNLSEEQIGAINAVQRINNELYDKFGFNVDWEHPLLSCTISSYYMSIEININEITLPLYNSSNNDRIYYEKSNKYEEWYSYIKRKFREIKQLLDSLKL